MFGTVASTAPVFGERAITPVGLDGAAPATMQKPRAPSGGGHAVGASATSTGRRDRQTTAPVAIETPSIRTSALPAAAGTSASATPSCASGWVSTPAVISENPAGSLQRTAPVFGSKASSDTD